ncbi:hypothetical protein V496_08451 [Pseudogymnoascus sp. VKM F-4515 (FW-2607)]|nr:hypothetical protein V496_08451 [Pseudogymnoascus sp. VKM F-4515 (FW-2607)]
MRPASSLWFAAAAGLIGTGGVVTAAGAPVDLISQATRPSIGSLIHRRTQVPYRAEPPTSHLGQLYPFDHQQQPICPPESPVHIHPLAATVNTLKRVHPYQSIPLVVSPSRAGVPALGPLHFAPHSSSLALWVSRRNIHTRGDLTTRVYKRRPTSTTNTVDSGRFLKGSHSGYTYFRLPDLNTLA